MTTIDATLTERGTRYGDFTDHARVAQKLQDEMRAVTGWKVLTAVQKQALTVIADKIARMLTGDPNYADNWHDIQGYAKLVEDRLSVSPSATAPDAEGWIEWKGGDRPVSGDAMVEVRLRNGHVNCQRARWYAWEIDNVLGDIDAYRIIKD